MFEFLNKIKEKFSKKDDDYREVRDIVMNEKQRTENLEKNNIQRNDISRSNEYQPQRESRDDFLMGNELRTLPPEPSKESSNKDVYAEIETIKKRLNAIETRLNNLEY
jgi:hypothetical protein